MQDFIYCLLKFLRDLIPTFVGVGLGIPAGLYLENRIKRHKKLESEKLAHQRELEILLLLKEELDWNSNRLLERRNGNQDPSLAMRRNSLKDTLWISLSASGDIKFIDDPLLLNRLASVYYVVGDCRELERLQMQSVVNRGITGVILENIGGFYQLASDSITEAQKMLKQKLKES